MRIKYRILTEKEADGGYHTWCPALPGCHVQGETKKEALNNLQDAIKLYIESLKDHGEPIPQDVEEDNIEVEV